MRDDLSQLMQRMEALPDRALVRLLEQERDQYTPAAIGIAEEEAEARGGLQQLKHQLALAAPERRHRRRGEQAKQHVEDAFSKLIGRAPSERYPALSYVAVALRLISFVLAVIAASTSGVGLYQLVAGSAEGWLATLAGSLRAGIAFLLFYGASEVINVVLDIEKNTREGRSRQQQEPG